jgi:hypothetical protein
MASISQVILAESGAVFNDSHAEDRISDKCLVMLTADMELTMDSYLGARGSLADRRFHLAAL